MPPEATQEVTEDQQQAAASQVDNATTAGGQEPNGQLTDEQLGQLPGWARASLEKANNEAAGFRSKLREKEQFIAESGGEDRIKRRAWNTTTEEGIKDLFKEMSDVDGIDEILGIPAGRLKTVLGDAQDAAQATAERVEAATGQPLEASQVQELVEKQVQVAVSNMTQTQEKEHLRTVVDAHLETSGYTDDWSRNMITQMAASHQKDADIRFDGSDKWSPYKQALDKGISDFEEWKSEHMSNRESYLKQKAGDADNAPKAVTGSTPASGEKWDPSDIDWDELPQAARERGYQI